VPLDPALSSFTVSGGRVFTQVRRNIGGQDREVCIALNADSGQELWATPLGIADYPDGGVGTDDGPRTTPSVDGNRLYVLTSYLQLACLNVTNGQVVWSNNLVAQYGSVVISWQNAASPLMENGVIFMNCNAPNRTFLALRASDGTQVWNAQTTDAMTQASPIITTLAGVRQVIFFAQSGLVSVAPDSGNGLWNYPFPFSVATAASPVAASNMVYCSAAYGVGAGAVQVTNSGTTVTATQAWRTPGTTMNHWATPVHYNGYLYGVYGQAGGTATLRCIQLATGNEMWRQAGSGLGSVLFTTGLVLMLTEDGYVVLVTPDPTGYNEVARYHALDGSSSSIPGLAVKCWNAPAIANGRIYARSTTEAVCLDVAPGGSSPPIPVTLSGSRLGGTGPFRLLIINQDNSPIDTNQAAKVSLLATINLGLGLNGWTQLNSPLLLTNGQLFLDISQSLTTPMQFFRAKVQPQ